MPRKEAGTQDNRGKADRPAAWRRNNPSTEAHTILRVVSSSGTQ